MFTPWIGLRNTALKTDKISTSWQASYRHTIATCNFRNFTSNEKSCTGFVLIVSIFLSVWPHTKNHKFLRIVYKRLPCDPRSLLSVYRSHLSELNTGIFCLIRQITLGQFAIFFLSFRYYLTIRQYSYISQCGNKYFYFKSTFMLKVFVGAHVYSLCNPWSHAIRFIVKNSY